MQVKSLSFARTAAARDLVPGRIAVAVATAAAPAGAGPRVADQLSGSSLNRALDVLGDWWTQRILRESFLGVRRFDIFQRHLEIPRQTLAVRLRSLVQHEILAATDEGYRLTPRGLALYPWALMIWRWSASHGGAAGPRHPKRLCHEDCGAVMRPTFACAACRREVHLHDVDYQPRRGAARAPVPPSGGHERRFRADKLVMGAKEAGANVAFLTADRWAHLILGAVFLGCRTFDVLQREVGIASNILSQRLRLLTGAGFLVKTRSADDGRRFIYLLTPQSRDAFPLTITLVQWADRWLTARRAPPMTRIHRACGRPFFAIVACSCCGEELLPQRVSHPPLPEPPARA